MKIYISMIQSICTQTIVGIQRMDGMKILLYSDEYFNKQWNEAKSGRMIMLELNYLLSQQPDVNRVCQKLNNITKNPVITKWENCDEQSLYNRSIFEWAKMRALFSMSSKIFLIIASILSGFFIMSLKNVDGVSSAKRFKFFKCKGNAGESIKNGIHSLRLNIRTNSRESVSLVTGFLLCRDIHS